jgi:O-antigen ligase
MRGGFALAVPAAGIALYLQLRLAAAPEPWRMRFTTVRVAASVAAMAAAALLLRGRLFDNGSDSGRLRIWLAALRHLQRSGIWGSGPAQVAELSRGELTTLLAHSDPLQYAGYYGLPGVIALALIGLRLGLLLLRRRAEVQSLSWSVALAATIALVCVMVVDFPLQVPVIPGLIALLLGATLGSEGRAAACLPIINEEGQMEGHPPASQAVAM